MAEYLYVGSFNPKGEAGYRIYRWDGEARTGELTGEALLEITAGVTCFDEKKGVLYFTDERKGNPDFKYGGGGRVFAVNVSPEDGSLTVLNSNYSYGALPSYVAADDQGKYLVLTNFGPNKKPEPITTLAKDESGAWRIQVQVDTASTVLLRRNEDGSVGQVCDIVVHSSEGTANNLRAAHAHSVVASPDKKLFAVCEMGTDRIYLFAIDVERDKLVLPSGAPYVCEKGTGPRYSAFHPTKPFFFINYEDAPLVSSFRYDEVGRLELINTIRVLPEGEEASPKDLQSGLTISADGRFLYTLMRGRNILAVFVVDQNSGKLSLLQRLQLDGDRPKDCSLSPDGRTLAVADRDSDMVELLAVAPDGTLKQTGNTLPQKAAGHVRFLSF